MKLRSISRAIPIRPALISSWCPFPAAALLCRCLNLSGSTGGGARRDCPVRPRQRREERCAVRSERTFRSRHALCMAAAAAVRFNEGMSEFYGWLIERGKFHKVALIAVMRKPAVLVSTLLRGRRTWKKRNPSASRTQPGVPGCALDQPLRRPAATAPAS